MVYLNSWFQTTGHNSCQENWLASANSKGSNISMCPHTTPPSMAWLERFVPLRWPCASLRKMVCRSRTIWLVSSCTVPLLRELLPFHHLSCSWDVLSVPACCARIQEPQWSQTRHLRNSNMTTFANHTLCRLVSLFLFVSSTEVLVGCLPPL